MEAMNPESLETVRQILVITWQEIWVRESAKHSIPFKPIPASAELAHLILAQLIAWAGREY